MLAAEIWHWWIGVVLAGAGLMVAIGLIAGYLKSVSSQQYPNRRNDADL